MTPIVPAQLEALRARLLAELPWSPFDYVEGISRAGDRALQVEAVLHALPPEFDLRFVAHDVAVFAEVLSWDTAFFGYRVARLASAFALGGVFGNSHANVAPAIFEFLARARAAGVRYLFAIDPRDLALQRALGACGFALVESRVHLNRPLVDLELSERYSIRRASEADLEGLEATVREMVNPYDRFHSDPFIRPADADHLMAQWVRASVSDGYADAVYVPDHPRPLAFCTTKLHENRWARWGVRLAQPVVLGAVAPKFRGWYRKLIGEICLLARERGAQHAFFVTQLANRAAIRSVERLGFRIGRGELVFRRLLSPGDQRQSILPLGDDQTEAVSSTPVDCEAALNLPTSKASPWQLPHGPQLRGRRQKQLSLIGKSR